jgi:hypothetical protein
MKRKIYLTLICSILLFVSAYSQSHVYQKEFILQTCNIINNLTINNYVI